MKGPAMKKQSDKKIPDYIWQIAAILLACVCAICFRPSMGVIRMLPIPMICMLIGAFLPIKRWQRAIYFLLLPLALNAVELNDNLLLAVAIIVLLVSFLLAEIAVWLFPKKKTVPVCIAVLLCLLCPIVNSFLIGNPISALKANSKIENYTDRAYDMIDGGIHRSGLSYDFYRHSYTVTLSSDMNPTETGTVVWKNGILTDGYAPVLEKVYQKKATETLSTEIRKVFPKDSFRILATGISGFPFSDIPMTQENDGTFDSAMTYCIRLSGRTDFEKLKASTLEYASALRQAGVPYETIVYTGYNALGARSVFALEACDYDGFFYHDVKPFYLTRRYGSRYEVSPDALLDYFFH